MKVYLDNFVLEEYNASNLQHREVIERLNQDKESKKYLGDFLCYTEK